MFSRVSYLHSLIFTILVGVCFSCYSPKESNSGQIVFKTDSISVSIDSSYLNSYYVFDYNVNTDEFIGYNRQRHSIDCLFLSTTEKKYHINLSKEGFNQVGDIQGIKYINKDSIFVFEYGFIKLMNQKGVVREVFRLHDAMNEKIPKSKVLSVNQYFKLQYNRNRKSFLLFNTFGREPYEDNYIVSEYHIENRLLTVLNIKFKDFDLENNNQLGFFAYLNGTIVGDSNLIYNYLYSPKIYRYNLYSGKTNSIIERNDLSKVVEMDNVSGLQSWERHAIENPHYFQIIEDKYKNLFYSLHWESVEYQVGKMQFNSFIDKKLVLSVFDKNFIQIGMLNLPKNTYMPFSWFVTPRGLMLSNTHPLNKNVSESNFTLHSISLEK